MTPENTGQNVSPRKTVTKAKVEIAKAKADLKVALDQIKSEQQARQKAEKALAEVLEDLSTARTDLGRERQARVETVRELEGLKETLGTALADAEQERQARIKSDQEKTEARMALGRLQPSAQEQPMQKTTPALEEVIGGEQRVSFVLRLTVDEQGHTKRTEIEHAQSGKKDVFPTLNVDRLLGFINSCIIPLELAELVTPQVSKETIKEANEPKKQATQIAIEGLQTECINDYDRDAAVFEADKAFLIRTSFKLQGVEPHPSIYKSEAYEIMVYACGIDQKLYTQLARYTSNLVEGVFDYTAQMKVPGLSSGLYRLSTLVKIKEPINAVGFYDGTILQIGRSQETLTEVTQHLRM